MTGMLTFIYSHMAQTTTVITDGLDQALELKYQQCPSLYPQTAIGSYYDYLMTPVPGYKLTPRALKASYGQIVLKMDWEFEDVLYNILGVSEATFAAIHHHGHNTA